MANIEIKEDTLSEIKNLAKDFLNEDSPKQTVTIDSDVATIGLRMVEVLSLKSTRNTTGGSWMPSRKN